ncbi:MAG: serine/threonine protein kinase [Acidobacteria bacterium]|nr:serine/threonine protein kinase [Acidobacteriota bacterium]
MDVEKWHQIEEIVVAALDVPTAERADFLDRRCGDDPELRREAASFLEHHDAGFLEHEDFEKLVGTTFDDSQSPFVGRQLGAFRIQREIGAGGMGTVFYATRDDGEFSQRAAVKIVRIGVDTARMRRRFQQERQILASLEHPNIARLVDGGTTADGWPYLVMEYVDGVPLTEFCADRNLPIGERLELFLRICRAVAFAHQNLIVHRDLKPSNILVTAEGEPKLLDFGLAKLTDENFSPDETQTQTAFRALTPAYASPEQLKGEPIRTSSDIYSLGVIFYELLTGDRPFRFDGKSLDEIIRTVAEAEPPAPSALTNSGARSPKLNADLDNIALTALRKEPNRRYASVEAFADDVERYLKGLPVAARPNTFAYRTGKFVRRHKLGVVAASLIFLSLIGATVFSLAQARAVRREQEKTETINKFLRQTLQYSNPVLSDLKKNGQETTVNEILDEAARRLDSGEFDAQPEVKAELELTVAATYYGQGKYPLARKYMEQYVILLRSLYAEDDPKMIAGSMDWAGLLFDRNEFAEAEKTFRKFLPLARREFENGRIGGEVLVNGLNNFAYLRRTQGDSREAEMLFRETLELIPRLSEPARRSVSTTRSTLASTLADQGRFDEALATAREAVEEYRARGEATIGNNGFSLTVLGGFLVEKGDYAEAAAVLTEGEAIIRKTFSPTSLWLGDNLRNQALLLYNQGKYPEAIARADETLKIYEEGFGKHYDQYPTALIAKGLSLAKSGRPDEGEKLLREAVKIRVETLPADHFWVALAKSALGECLTLEKKYDEAEPLLKESFDTLQNTQGAANPRTLLAQSRLAAFYEKRR